jgi:quaternary ammonium compound-resistance protein SugE
MAWLMLVAAGLLEIGFAVALARSDGFSKLLPTLVFAACAAASFTLLNLALKELPVGTAYAVWTGIGAAGTALVGIAFLGEPGDVARIACIGLIVAAVVGLQLTGAA